MKILKNISFLLADFLVPLKKANWKIVFLCVLTATIFWFFNALNKEYTTRIDYPVSIVFNDDSLIAVKDLPEEIPINVTGGGWQLLKKTISVNVDPVIIEPENPVQMQFLTGINLLPVFSEQLKDVNVNYIATDTIFFQIEPIIEKLLHVRIDSSNIKLRENYYITSEVHLKPDTILFRGPASEIEEMTDAYIIELSDNNIDDDYDQELSMDLFSSSRIKKNPEIIHVWFNVDEFVDKEIALNVELVNFPYDSSRYLNYEQINVYFKVQKQFKEEIDNSGFTVIADLSNINRQDSTISLEVIDFPDHVKEISLSPEVLKVKYAR